MVGEMPLLQQQGTCIWVSGAQGLLKVPFTRQEKKAQKIQAPNKSWKLGDMSPVFCSTSPGSGGGGQSHRKSPCHPVGLPEPCLCLGQQSPIMCVRLSFPICKVGVTVALLTFTSSCEGSVR